MAAAKNVQETLKVSLLRNGQVPKRGTAGAAGLDLRSAYGRVLKAHSTGVVYTHVRVKIPSGHYGRIASRSSLAIEGVEVGAGVVDEDYTGEIKVILHNLSAVDFRIREGDRIAQLIIEPYIMPEIEVCQDWEYETARGFRGFGSTGRK